MPWVGSCFTAGRFIRTLRSGPARPAPQAVTVELTAMSLRLLDALSSRSWTTPHASQTHSRSASVRPACRCPHALHSLLDGNQRLATTTRELFIGAL